MGKVEISIGRDKVLACHWLCIEEGGVFFVTTVTIDGR